MVRLILKCPYIKAGKKNASRQGAGGYMKYIATREGVEKIVPEGPVTEEQKKLINEILVRCPDSMELYEYEDYLNAPNSRTASAFLTTAIDTNLHDDAVRGGYMKYIATRPRAERHGEHGLFSSRRDVDLNAAIEQLNRHQGNVWTFILSLRREDAARLGYDNAEAWRNLLMRHQHEIAQNMHVPVNQLHWYAAFHNEGHHPHVHAMIWSDNNRIYLNREGITTLRSLMTKDIFKDDLLHLYERKDVSYKELVDLSRERMKEIAAHVRDASVSPALLEKLAALSEAMKTVTGKKQYGYLPKPLKALVNSIVDELAELPEIRDAYEAWNEIKDELDGYYHDALREHLPLRDQKEFRAIKNAVVREAVRLSMDHAEEEPEQSDVPRSEDAPDEPGPEVFPIPVNHSAHERQERSSGNHQQTANSSDRLAQSGVRLLYHLSRIFPASLPDAAPLAFARVDSKRRRKLLEKRLALGHNIHDHELADNEISQTM